jgi:hypothetical protein
VGAFLLTALCLIYLIITLTYHLFYCTCWVSTISVLNLVVFPCYSNLLLGRRRWTRILRWGVLGYVLPRLSFLWCYGVFRCSTSLRVILIFKRLYLCNNYTLYSWHLVICEHFWPYVWNNWSWAMHIMSTRFWHKNRVWHFPHIENIFFPLWSHWNWDATFIHTNVFFTILLVSKKYATKPFLILNFIYSPRERIFLMEIMVDEQPLP